MKKPSSGKDSVDLRVPTSTRLLVLDFRAR
jgi:hypothetical protein